MVQNLFVMHFSLLKKNPLASYLLMKLMLLGQNGLIGTAHVTSKKKYLPNFAMQVILYLLSFTGIYWYMVFKYSEVSGDREVQRTMLELLNQLDGFSSDERIKVFPCASQINWLIIFLFRMQSWHSFAAVILGFWIFSYSKSSLFLCSYVLRPNDFLYLLRWDWSKINVSSYQICVN